MSPSLFLHARNDVHIVARVHDTATRPFARLHLLGTHPKRACTMNDDPASNQSEKRARAPDRVRPHSSAFVRAYVAAASTAVRSTRSLLSLVVVMLPTNERRERVRLTTVERSRKQSYAFMWPWPEKKDQVFRNSGAAASAKQEFRNVPKCFA